MIVEVVDFKIDPAKHQA
ncbi:MAG: hypothetical protein RSB42_09810, partial [Comamonas sp.]